MIKDICYFCGWPINDHDERIHACETEYHPENFDNKTLCRVCDERDKKQVFRITPKGLHAIGYRVTEDGKIISMKGGKEKELKYDLHNEGYWKVRLHIDGKRINVKAHVIVAQYHHGQRHEYKSVVRHLDDDKKNVHPSNLEYGSQKQNMRDKVRNKKRRMSKC